MATSNSNPIYTTLTDATINLLKTGTEWGRTFPPRLLFGVAEG
jgi:hypothetical protein